MRRFRVSEIALGFIFATALWVVVLWFATDPQTYHQVCEANQQTGKESCTSHNVFYVVFWYAGYWLAASAAAITALATGFIAWFTLTLRRSTDRLWDASERQLNAINDNAARQSADMATAVAETRRIGEAQVRTYVDITRCQVILLMPQVVGMGETTLLRMIARNTGQSPARNFLWHPTVQFISTARPGVVAEQSMGGNWREIIGIGIPVGESHEDGAMMGRPPLQQLSRGSQTATLIVRVRIDFEFDDVFGVHHVDEAYFVGIFAKKLMGFDKTDYGPTQWEGVLRRTNPFGDWNTVTKIENAQDR